jgi:hypothetical protein
MRTFAIAPSAGRGPRRRDPDTAPAVLFDVQTANTGTPVPPIFRFLFGCELGHTHDTRRVALGSRTGHPTTHTNGSTCREPARDCDGHAAIFSEARLHPGFCERQGPAASGISRAFALQLLCIDLRASSKKIRSLS